MKSLINGFRVLHPSVRSISSNILTNETPVLNFLCVSAGDLSNLLSKQQLKSPTSTVKEHLYSSNSAATFIQNEEGGELGTFVHHSDTCAVDSAVN